MILNHAQNVKKEMVIYGIGVTLVIVKDMQNAKIAKQSFEPTHKRKTFIYI